MNTTSKRIVGIVAGGMLLAGAASAVAATGHVSAASHVSAATAIEYGLHATPAPTAVEY
jgi:hypothetical protein